MSLLKVICLFFRALQVPRMALAAENIALRQQSGRHGEKHWENITSSTHLPTCKAYRVEFLGETLAFQTFAPTSAVTTVPSAKTTFCFARSSLRNSC